MDGNLACRACGNSGIILYCNVVMRNNLGQMVQALAQVAPFENPKEAKDLTLEICHCYLGKNLRPRIYNETTV